MHKVYDTCNQLLAAFPTYQAAEDYKSLMHRPDWRITCPILTDRISTDKQKRAVKFCELVLSSISGQDIKMEGNINSFNACAQFLNKYLESCNTFMSELASEFTTDRGY